MNSRKRNWKLSKRGRVIIGAATVIAAVVLIAGCVAAVHGLSKSENIVATAETDSDTTQDTTQEATTDPHILQARSRLTGLWVDKATVNNSPVAVMFSNIAEAMPQSSLSYADVVFESLVEGNITRLCGVFENGTALGKIGPVRSCRTYYLFFAKEFEATYVHFGYSEYAAAYLQKSEMHALDGMVYCSFFRSSDRVAPHNAYTSWTGIMQSAAERNYPTTYPADYKQPYTFNTDDSKDITIASGQSCLRFYPGYSYNKPWFSYDSTSRLYARYQFGGPQTDAETGAQLKYKNILVKYIGGGYWPNGTPNYTISGTGKGLYITDGVATEVKWVKDSEYGATKYYNQDGSEIVLNQGKTWVCQIEKDAEGSVKILDTLQ